MDSLVYLITRRSIGAGTPHIAITPDRLTALGITNRCVTLTPGTRYIFGNQLIMLRFPVGDVPASYLYTNRSTIGSLAEWACQNTYRSHRVVGCGAYVRFPATSVIAMWQHRDWSPLSHFSSYEPLHQ